MRASYLTKITLYVGGDCTHYETNEYVRGDESHLVLMPSHCPECGSADWGPE